MIETLKGTFQCLYLLKCGVCKMCAYSFYASLITLHRTATLLSTQVTHNFDFSIKKRPDRTSERWRESAQACVHVRLHAHFHYNDSFMI